MVQSLREIIMYEFLVLQLCTDFFRADAPLTVTQTYALSLRVIQISSPHIPLNHNTVNRIHLLTTVTPRDHHHLPRTETPMTIIILLITTVEPLLLRGTSHTMSRLSTVNRTTIAITIPHLAPIAT